MKFTLSLMWLAVAATTIVVQGQDDVPVVPPVANETIPEGDMNDNKVDTSNEPDMVGEPDSGPKEDGPKVDTSKQPDMKGEAGSGKDDGPKVDTSKEPDMEGELESGVNDTSGANNNLATTTLSGAGVVGVVYALL
mmetsp:Transcript_62202/g.71414  ORF Transcript_62202/g.71414 Transcript_62202/m.71414 type:complete len:136 (-) Transcript_62202:261-668(-)